MATNLMASAVLASFITTLNSSNVLLWVIAGCSLASFTIFIERLIYLKRAEVDSSSLLISLRDSLQDGHIVAAIDICENTHGTVSNIIKAGLLKHHRSKDRIENAMEMAGLIEIAKLEKNAKLLSIIAYIAPLIGLLGTVLGFIQAFGEMRLSNLVDISATRLGEAMEYALITTAAGLVVAIPSILAYNYLVSRIEGFILEIQTTSAEVVDLLIESHEKSY